MSSRAQAILNRGKRPAEEPACGHHDKKKAESLTVAEAVAEYNGILARLDNELVPEFAEYVTGRTAEPPEGAVIEDRTEEGMETLDRIRKHIRKTMGRIDAMAPGEKVAFPTKGQFAEFNNINSQHVDSFLLSDDDVDELVEQGELSRYYCKSDKCGHSRDLGLLNFISHSFSRAELCFIFSENVLGNLQGKTLLDVGSRLGSTLYAGHLFSEARELVGVELSEYFCDMQKKVAKKFKMTDRISVVHGDVFADANKALVEKADVVVMNNVFDMFCPESELEQAWRNTMKAFNKKGTILITNPALHESFEAAGISLESLDKWVKESELAYPQPDDDEDVDEDEFTGIHMYTVK